MASAAACWVVDLMVLPAVFTAPNKRPIDELAATSPFTLLLNDG